ncbi:MAG: sugar transferase [Deltaproteobacteria bacterium]|nr:MAG: sugar transferase [Deltaproteobacteria bacterium]
MFERRATSFRLIFLSLDLIAWALAFAAAWRIRQSPYFASQGEIAPLVEYLPFLAVALSALVLGALAGSRVRRGVAVLDEVGDVARGTGAVFIAMFVVLFALRVDYSRIMFGLWAVLAVVLVVALRRMARSVASNMDGYHRRVAIVGDGQLPHELAKALQVQGGLGIEYAGAVPIHTDGKTPMPCLGTLSDIRRIIQENVIDEVLFVVGHANLADIEVAFMTCEEMGVETRLVLDFFPHKHSRIHLDHVDGYPALSFDAAAGDDLGRLLKRVFDILVSLCFLVLGSPVYALVALAVKLDSKGPVFFSQERVGRHGRPFKVHKFRSMVTDAEELKAALMAQNERDGPAFKMKDDPRVTRVGKLIRKTSLDEIPQFYNVLVGEMSIVGPRPPLPNEVAQYDHWQRRRLSVRPGITCLWQVSGRGDVDFETWMRLDLQYIDNWSLWLDLKIFLMTIPAVLLQKGSS